MKKLVFTALLGLIISSAVNAQALKTFTVDMQPNQDAFLSIKDKKAYPEKTALAAKQNLDLALVVSKADGQTRIEWYNFSGKDEKIPTAYVGTATLVNAISFDKDQFDKCKTVQDMQKMTGYLTANSFSHFATISNSKGCAPVNACYVLQNQGGKRALLWVESSGDCNFKVSVKSVY